MEAWNSGQATESQKQFSKVAKERAILYRPSETLVGQKLAARVQASAVFVQM